MWLLFSLFFFFLSFSFWLFLFGLFFLFFFEFFFLVTRIYRRPIVKLLLQWNLSQILLYTGQRLPVWVEITISEMPAVAITELGQRRISSIRSSSKRNGISYGITHFCGRGERWDESASRTTVFLVHIQLNGIRSAPFFAFLGLIPSVPLYRWRTDRSFFLVLRGPKGTLLLSCFFALVLSSAVAAACVFFLSKLNRFLFPRNTNLIVSW